MSQSCFFAPPWPAAPLDGVGWSARTRRWLKRPRAEWPAPAPGLPLGLADLLGRAEVAPDWEAVLPWVGGARVLITGAGGTLGAELARQVLALRPERLVLLDHAEHALWRVAQELGRADSVEAVLADIRDAGRMREVFAAARPAIVLHAAALKHVPMVEAHPLEGLLTNAVGTRVVAEAAREADARAMVLLATDKAVAPASVMGASKRLAELWCQAADRAWGAHERCLTVRFGNVLGSSGSVLELWLGQRARGQALSLTHPDMTRYLTTPREAAGLILRGLALGMAGEVARGGLCLLDMGGPVRMADLAARVFGPDVTLAVTGVRPGEKLDEALLHEDEAAVPSAAPGLLVASARGVDLAILARAFDELEALCRAGQVRLALGLVSRLIPGFRPGTACRDGRMRA